MCVSLDMHVSPDVHVIPDMHVILDVHVQNRRTRSNYTFKLGVHVILDAHVILDVHVTYTFKSDVQTYTRSWREHRFLRTRIHDI